MATHPDLIMSAERLSERLYDEGNRYDTAEWVSSEGGYWLVRWVRDVPMPLCDGDCVILYLSQSPMTAEMMYPDATLYKE